MSFLATSIANVDELYSSLGDTAAYSLILDHHRLLADNVTASGGTIVKTIGERTLAVFPRREQAMEAATRIRQTLADETNSSIHLGIGIHCGPTLVATQNNRLDYFGGTVRAVLKLPKLAISDTLVTEAVYSDSAIRETYLKEYDQVESVRLPGSPNTRCKRMESSRGDIS